MATRFWFSSVTGPINPGTIGTWGSSSLKSVKTLWGSAPPDDDTFTTYNINATGSFTAIHRQYVSAGMDAGIVFDSSTTYTLTVRCSESSTAANAYMRMHVAIVSNDGSTVRAQFSSGEVDGSEMSTTLSSRSNTKTGGISYTTVAGDRLIVELGYDKNSTGTYTISFSYGNTAASDLSSTDGDTGTDNPWFETSNTITFGGAGVPTEPTPPAENEDFDVTTFISAVLDEWV